ncbi:MAG: hypothetical protein L0H93_07050, partial [Nocardioides sp.]|nr:hypothetical protein [Nocardioides sp.]
MMEHGTRLPVFRDAHVHLGLIDPTNLRAHGIGAVVDLGWAPSIVDLARQAPVDVAFAGAFLTARGGYPGDRGWAPEGSVIEVDRGSAADAVAAQVAMGAVVIKVSLNSAAGPLLDLDTVLAITAAAADAGVAVVSHVEGEGAFETALAAGVDILAHTPWTARLSERQIRDSAQRQSWISTLDIHGYGTPTLAQKVAVENAARFHAAGGRLF